jgi:hypothetical protein
MRSSLAAHARSTTAPGRPAPCGSTEPRLGPADSPACAASPAPERPPRRVRARPSALPGPAPRRWEAARASPRPSGARSPSREASPGLKKLGSRSRQGLPRTPEGPPRQTRARLHGQATHWAMAAASRAEEEEQPRALGLPGVCCGVRLPLAY